MILEQLLCCHTDLQWSRSCNVWLEVGFCGSVWWLLAEYGETGGYTVFVIGLVYTGSVGVAGMVSR